ncbi:MAG: 50S ribosomal protein L29 [Gammaproteobacteria bacterium]
MKAAELRDKNPEELDTMLNDELRKLFRLRMQKGSGQLGNPSEFRQIRRDVARIKTVMHENEKGDK